ncbi:MAG: sensor domain-containing diguanylate cyclase [Acidobacteria bacterium]|nr:sensor domain-containing diguanylate cyclase [Acidobacteriota bacterium]
MQFIFVYKTQPLPKWVNLLDKLGNGEAEIIECEEIQDFGAGYNPSAVFCELYPDCENIVKILKGYFPSTPFFSFTAKTKLKEKSFQLGFASNLDEDITLKELALHLFYGNQINKIEDNYLSQRKVLANELTKLHLSLDKQQVIKSFIKTLPQILNLDSLAIFLISEDGKFLELANNLNVKEPITLVKLAGANSLLAKVVKYNRALLLNENNMDFNQEEHFQKNKFSSVIYLPLSTQSRVLGVLEIAQTNKIFTQMDLSYAEEIANNLAIALSNAVNFAQVERLGRIDDLTKLYNPRYLYQMLETEVKRARRYKTPLSVIFLDLDGFKAVNDNNGHLCGSAVLVEVANLIIRLVRDTDIVARYGGDEFVIVLPGTPAEQAVIIAERIRQSIGTHGFKNNGDYKEIYLTASFGVACYPEHASLPLDLIRCADKAMYLAKEYNKNQVVLAS